ncbi:hypothetical protein H0H93_002954 [Arthromyces matolae]|nr:hypothetical protein H0H93_002954 [Arthromyces matolae]
MTTTSVDTRISIPLGIVIGLLASFVQSLGLTIQRKSHVLNQMLPEHEQRVEHHRPLWLLGFAVFISSNVIGSLVQIASLPVVILAPLGAVSLLWNAFFARIILGDFFSLWMVLGTVLIAGGAVLIAFFGIVPEQTRSLEDLLALFSRPAFVIYFSILGSVVLVCLIITHLADFALSHKLSQTPLSSSSPDIYPRHPLASPSQPSAALTTGLSTPIADVASSTERTPLLKHSTASSVSSVPGKLRDTDRAIHRSRLLLAISYSSFSGVISGMCLLFAKSGVELLLLTLGGENQFWRWQAWVLVISLAVFALLQLWYLHKALVLADPTLVCPWMSILLGGVWIVSVQSGVREGDLKTWNKSDDSEAEEIPDVTEISTSDIEEAIASEGPPRLHGHIEAVPMERGTRSESNISDLPRLESVDRSEAEHGTLTSSTASTRAANSHHRRRSTYDVDHNGMPSSTTHQHLPLSPMNTLTGFQIGLSPVSPGFAIQPRRVSGRGFSDVVIAAERRRRRTVSEGNVRKDVLGQRRLEEDNEREGQSRWRWLRRIIRD